MNGKCEEIEQFEVAPHPAFSHLLPDGEGKKRTGCFSPKTIKFTNEINALKTLARFGRGGTASAVGEGLDQKRKK